MRPLFDNPKTSLGGVVVLAGVVMLFIKGMQETGMTLIGLGGTWIGVTAKDGGK